MGFPVDKELLNKLIDIEIAMVEAKMKKDTKDFERLRQKAIKILMDYYLEGLSEKEKQRQKESFKKTAEQIIDMMIGIYEKAGLFDIDSYGLDILETMMGTLFKSNDKAKTSSA